MVISLSRRLAFIANTKTASTSIEQALAPLADLRNDPTPQSKHLTAAQVRARFRGVLTEAIWNSIFSFGVVREPVEWVVSWFNYRSRPQLQGETHYCGGASFAQFVEAVERGAGIGAMRAQEQCFRHPASGALLVDTLIPLPQLAGQLTVILGRAGLSRRWVERALEKPANVSEVRRLGPRDVPADLAARIRARFAGDVELYRAAAEAQDLAAILDRRLDAPAPAPVADAILAERCPLEHGHALAGRARAQLRAGRARFALALARRARMLLPEEVSLVLLCGAAASQADEHELAERDFREAIERAPTPAAFAQLARALERAGKADAASAALDEAGRRWPDAPELRLRRGAVGVTRSSRRLSPRP